MIKMKIFLVLAAIFSINYVYAQSNVFPNSGNVGIGNASPVEKLQVRGNVRFDRLTGGNNFTLFHSDSGGNYITTDDPGTNQKNLYIRVAPTGDDQLNRNIYLQAGKVNGAFQTRMAILGNGNVGLGINNPTDRLAVNGNIRAKEIKVETANWPDYVFEEDYQMPSLTETEAFIKKHKHLPGMPNKEQVAAEGISLGEMNRKLLEKVEELTLHLIREQEARIALTNEVQVLKKQMNNHD